MNKACVLRASARQILPVWREIAPPQRLERLNGKRPITRPMTSNSAVVGSGSADQTIVLWDVETKTQATTLRGHVDQVQCLRVATDRHRLISASRDGEVRIWDPHQRTTWPITVESAVAGARQSHFSPASFSFDGK